jgi:hypothetical protein
MPSEILKTILLKKLIDIADKNLRILCKYLENIPKEQLLQIPKGHHNNIWWNIAHVVVTQQLLVYKLSGLPLRIPTGLVEKFKNGTVPNGSASSEEIEKVKELLFSTMD